MDLIFLRLLLNYQWAVFRQQKFQIFDRVWAKLICRQQAPQPEGRWSNICWSNSGAIDEYDDDDAYEDEGEDDNYLLKQLRRCQWMVNTSPHTWIVPITFAIRTVVDFKQFCWIQLHSDDNALINSLVLPLRIKTDESKLMLMEQNQVHIPKEKTHITYRYHPYSHTQSSLHCIGLPQQCWNFLIFPSYLDCFWIDSRLMQLGSISINSRLTLNGFHINSLKGNLIIMRSLFFLRLAGLGMVSWGDGADINFTLIKVTLNAGKHFVKFFYQAKETGSRGSCSRSPGLFWDEPRTPESGTSTSFGGFQQNCSQKIYECCKNSPELGIM